MDKLHKTSAETWETVKSIASAVSWAAGPSVPKCRKPFLAMTKVYKDGAANHATHALAVVAFRAIAATTRRQRYEVGAGANAVVKSNAKKRAYIRFDGQMVKWSCMLT